MATNQKTSGLVSLYLLGFLFAFHVALPTYVNSSFLNVFISEKFLGIIYTLASTFTIILFFITPLILRWVGNYRFSLFVILVEIGALLGLIFNQTPLFLAIFFIISLTAISLIYFLFDVFLEGYTQNKETGRVRGIYLTFTNLAWIFSPIISGLILYDNSYWKIYLAALMFSVPIFLIIVFKLRNFKDSDYQIISVGKTLKKIWQNKDVRNILWANFLLQFFYCWMTIYTPLFLNKNAGFSWGEIGIIFGIMLIPFVFVQFPLGRIADEKIGEQEILSVGFIIMAVATAALSLVLQWNYLWLWALLLFATRLGAASVEVMCNTYFFKKVNCTDANIISFLQISRLFAYIIGPLVLVLFLNLFETDSGQPFLVLGLIMLSGLWFGLNIKDTK